MEFKSLNLNDQNEEIENYDKLVNEVKDILKDIEKLSTEAQFEKIRVCEKGMSSTNQPAFFPVAFRSVEARSIADQIFNKALLLIRDELLEKFVARYNDGINRLNGTGDSRFTKIPLGR